MDLMFWFCFCTLPAFVAEFFACLKAFWVSKRFAPSSVAVSFIPDVHLRWPCSPLTKAVDRCAFVCVLRGFQHVVPHNSCSCGARQWRLDWRQNKGHKAGVQRFLMVVVYSCSKCHPNQIFKVLVIQNAFLQLVQSCRLRCCLWFILSFLYSQCHQCFPLDCRMRSSQGNFKRQIHVSLCIQNSRSATWRKRSVNMSQCHHLQL